MTGFRPIDDFEDVETIAFNAHNQADQDEVQHRERKSLVVIPPQTEQRVQDSDAEKAETGLNDIAEAEAAEKDDIHADEPEQESSDDQADSKAETSNHEDLKPVNECWQVQAPDANEQKIQAPEIEATPDETAAGVAPQEQKPVSHLSNKEVTDHTASLWKYLPIPEHEPEPAPEYKVFDAQLPGTKVVGARVRGKKHKHEGSNCDDWFEISNYEDVTFIAVSDGAGSKKFSRIGARESCRTAAGYLVNAYVKLIASEPGIRDDLKLPISDAKCVAACGRIAGLVQQSVLHAWNAVESAFYARAADEQYEKVLKRKLQLADLSGTFLVAAILPVRKETKEHLIVTCQVGDGMIATVNTKGAFSSSVKLLGVPDSGEFTGETEFLTSSKMAKIEELQKRTKLSLGPVDVVMMMTDGVADDYFPNETQMGRLYFDLIVNGILKTEAETKSLSDLTPEQLRMFKRIPDPISYPWVNDQNVLVPIQYTNRLMEAMGLSLDDLWANREVLMLAELELRNKDDKFTVGERLTRWLDNYYERGSFDDRTLVVAEL